MKFWKLFFDILARLQKTSKVPESEVYIPPKIEDEPEKLDWTNPKHKISDHFTVYEALWLPSWGVMHQPSEAEKEEILKLAQKMDRIRNMLNRPIKVHVWMRPKLNCLGHEKHGEDYNRFVYERIWKRQGKTPKQIKKLKEANSAHKYGMGVDWHAKGKKHKCDEVRKTLKPLLADLGLRMEDRKGSNWIHNDSRPPGSSGRYFPV